MSQSICKDDCRSSLTLVWAYCVALTAGNVVIDANGRPRVNYTLSKYDGESCLNGVINGAEILLSSGARRITTAQPGVPSYHVPVDSQGLADPRFKSWIEQVRKAGVWPGITALGSAHQMGSCAMSTSAATGVVDPRGRVWGTSGLYVADAVSVNERMIFTVCMLTFISPVSSVRLPNSFGSQPNGHDVFCGVLDRSIHWPRFGSRRTDESEVVKQGLDAYSGCIQVRQISIRTCTCNQYILWNHPCISSSSLWSFNALLSLDTDRIS